MRFVRQTLFLLTLVVTASALAQSGGGDATDAAREAFWQGNEAYTDGDYPTAIEHFERAHSLAPNARLLDYIGRSYVALRRYPEAIEAFERCALEDPAGAAEVEATIAALQHDMRVHAFSAVQAGIGAAVRRANGEQPRSLDQRRTELGTTMTDVPVQIVSTPRAASVFIDGTEFGEFGVTPLETPLFTGPHLIEVHRDYYAPQSRVVNVTVPRRDESIVTVSFELERLQVPCVIEVDPSTASVTYISDSGDRVDLGRGEYEGVLPAGPGTFIIQQGGRDRRIETVIEPEGEDSENPGEFRATVQLDERAVSSSIQIRVGMLTIVSDLDDGDVSVDGRSVGRPPGEFEVALAPGPHTLVVSRDGYVSFEQEIEITADSESTVFVHTLERARGRRR